MGTNYSWDEPKAPEPEKAPDLKPKGWPGVWPFAKPADPKPADPVPATDPAPVVPTPAILPDQH